MTTPCSSTCPTFRCNLSRHEKAWRDRNGLPTLFRYGSILLVILVAGIPLPAMALPRHGAVGAVRTAGRLASLFVPHQRPHGQSQYGDQRDTDQDDGYVSLYPCQHIFLPFLAASTALRGSRSWRLPRVWVRPLRSAWYSPCRGAPAYRSYRPAEPLRPPG